jgi:hypothetical protein
MHDKLKQFSKLLSQSRENIPSNMNWNGITDCNVNIFANYYHNGKLYNNNEWTQLNNESKIIFNSTKNCKINNKIIKPRNIRKALTYLIKRKAHLDMVLLTKFYKLAPGIWLI